MRYVVEFDNGERFEIELDAAGNAITVEDGESVGVAVERADGGVNVTTGDGRRARLRLDYEDGQLVVCLPDGRRRRVRVELAEAEAWRRAVCAEPPRAGATVPDELPAPIAGSVVRLLVAPGARVAEGDPLMIIDAMKMQNSITAPKAGVVTFKVEAGQSVRAGHLIATITETELTK